MQIEIGNKSNENQMKMAMMSVRDGKISLAKLFSIIGSLRTKISFKKPLSEM